MLFEPVVDNLGFFATGYLVTLVLFVASFAAALVIGVLVASARVWGSAPLRVVAATYTEFFRDTPLLVQLIFFASFLARTGVTREEIVVGIIGLGLYTGAYVAEVVRAGVLSVDARQMETARSLGMSQVQALRHVVLPQALRSVIPPLGNLSIALVKNTAVASAIPVADLLYQADIIASRTFRLDPYLAAIVGYLSLTLTLTWIVRRLERRMAFAR